MLKIVLSLFITISHIYGQNDTDAGKKTFPLISGSGLELINVKAEAVDHIGKQGIQISGNKTGFDYATLVVIPDVEFKDGTITIELTGEPAVDAPANMRGFVGIAFRVNPDNYSSYECFYLRPVNGRAQNQLQRNHSTQYVSHPEYPWYRLREENPGLYESYVDLVAGEWTKIKIEVSGKTAKFYVHGVEQPCLIVDDLKKGESTGKIALWLHPSTLARYRNLEITPK